MQTQFFFKLDYKLKSNVCLCCVWIGTVAKWATLHIGYVKLQYSIVSAVNCLGMKNRDLQTYAY